MMQQINILYAPGLGGNHLANLIAMDKKFKLDLNLSVYDEQGENVHQLFSRHNNFVEINTMHMGEFVGRCKQKLIKSNAINILISLPDPGEKNLAYQRLVCWSPEYKNTFIHVENIAIYSLFVVFRIANCLFVNLKSSVLFNDDTSELLKFLATLGITLDSSTVDTFHRKWITKIQTFIKEKKQNENNCYF